MGVSEVNAHVLCELADLTLPPFNASVALALVGLARLEDKDVLIAHLDAEFVVYIRGWTLLLRLFLCLRGVPSVVEAHCLNLARCQINVTLDDARFVEMEVIEDASTIDCNDALIHKDHALFS